jgi:hypothetical protein
MIHDGHSLDTPRIPPWSSEHERKLAIAAGALRGTP